MQTTVLIIKILIFSLLNETCNIHIHSILIKTKEDKEATLIIIEDNEESRKKSKNRKQNINCKTESEDKCFTCNKRIYLKNNYYNIYSEKYSSF